MPRSQGVYSLPSGNPIEGGSVANSTTMNTTLTDLGTEITNSIARNGTSAATANLPMGNFRHTAVGNAQARNQYSSAAQIQDGSLTALINATGTNTITADFSPAISAYSDGMRAVLVPAANNTGAVTLAVNGLSAVAVVKNNGVALETDDLVTDIPAYLIYFDTQFFLLNPQVLQNEYRRSAAEIASGVIPVNYGFLPGNVLRYGAVGDDDSDCSEAFLDAFAQLKAGGAIIHVPAGIYVVSESLNYELDDPTTTQQPGFLMRGDGMYRSIIRSSAASSTALHLRINDVDSAAFLNGSLISDLSIEPSGTPASQNGLKLNGCLGIRLDRVRIAGFSGHGLYVPSMDGTFPGGPDAYSVYYVEAWQCKFDLNTLHGVCSEMGAAFNISLRDCSINSNDQGGVYLAGSTSGEIKNCSISNNATDGNGFGGLTMPRSTGDFGNIAQTMEISRNEFDGNHNVHILIGALNQSRIYLNRFISADNGGLTKHVPAKHVAVDLSPSGNVTDVVFERNFHRRTGSTYAMTAYDLGNDGNVTQVEIIDARYNSTSNVTKYTNINGNSRVQIEEGGIIIRSNFSGSPAVGRIIAGTPSLSGSATDVVWSSESTDKNSALDVSTGIYTCPATGMYNVSCGLTLTGLADGNIVTMRLVRNVSGSGDNTSREMEFEADGSTNFTSQLNTLIECLAGDTLRITAFQNSGSGKSIRVGEPYNWFCVALNAK